MKKVFVVSMCILFVYVNTSFSGEIYKWVDDKGVVHYSDSPANKSNLGVRGVEIMPAIDYVEPVSQVSKEPISQLGENEPSQGNEIRRKEVERHNAKVKKHNAQIQRQNEIRRKEVERHNAKVKKHNAQLKNRYKKRHTPFYFMHPAERPNAALSHPLGGSKSISSGKKQPKRPSTGPFGKKQPKRPSTGAFGKKQPKRPSTGAFGKKQPKRPSAGPFGKKQPKRPSTGPFGK